MNILHHVGRLYSLNTLDTRFTTSSKTSATQIDPAKPSPEVGRKSRNGLDAAARVGTSSRWRTPEFMIYGLVIVVAIPWMFKTVYDVSQPTHPNYSKFEPLLSTGWIPGRKVDNSDQQYATFRDNVPYLFIVLMMHPLLRRLFDRFYSASSYNLDDATQRISNVNTSAFGIERTAADGRQKQRITFDVCFGIVFLFALHGVSAVKILLILYINYTLATRLKKEYVPIVTWAFNIGILFANELGRGYPYEMIAGVFSPWSKPPISSETKTPIANWGSLLDSYGGLIPRWEILFNFTVLRLISFNFDYHWSFKRSSGSPLEKKQLDPVNLSERDRVDIPAKSGDYTLFNYLAYTLYSPLYLAGPILTFNDYVSQQRYSPRSITFDRTLLYGVRFFLSLLVMEIMIHFIYVVAISKAQPAWEVYTPFQLSMLGYFNLHHIWLKLLLPWRFFRLWALIDGIDPPENMVRCMSDNYSASAFWRGWHRSFNRWIVRYIYIPMGGSGRPSTRGQWGTIRSIANMLAVFTFVAMWHDIQLRLLVWGWLITLFVLPETLAGFMFPKQKWKDRPEVYRIICGIGAVGNILMMMSANLVGFAVGLDGLKGLVQGIVGSYAGLVFLAGACIALFTGVQVMFELRQQELRQGIQMKC